MKNSQPELGDRARDTVTGFEGIVTATCAFLNGCQRVQLQPPVDAEGKPREGVYFDVEHVEVVETGVVASYLAPAHRQNKGSYADPPRR